MQSTFGGLNTALLALSAQRKALDVAAHNVANANTEGYTRQEAVMEASFHTNLNSVRGSAQVGTGVDVRTVRRMRDSFLDYQIRSQSWALGRWETTSNYLQEIETVFNEPSDSGLASLMNKMWGSWQDLNSSPESYVARAAVVQNASVLTDVLRRNAGQLSEIRAEAAHQIDLKVSEVNGWLSQVAELNSQIPKVRVTGDAANDLSDKRDLLMDRLSRALHLGYEEQSDGSVTIWLGDRAAGTEQTLVEANRTNGLRVEDTSGEVLWDDGDPAATDPPALVEDGELKAALNVRDHVLNPSDPEGLMGQLDTLATSLIEEVNNLHAPGGVGQKFFEGTGAQDIRVAGALVADPSLVVAGTSGTGDGSIALAIAQLQTKRVLSGGAATLGDSYNALISKLGVDGQQARGMTANQSLLVSHLKQNREAFSGVSLDEEAAGMIRFERAYQAAARVLTAMDEMLERIINGLGLVGR